jgi:hypothetical protein
MRNSDEWKYRQNVIHTLYLPEYKIPPHPHSSIFRKMPTKNLLNFVYNLKVTLNFSYDKLKKILVLYLGKDGN